MDPPSILKFAIKENRKTRSNGLPIIDHSLSPGGLCTCVAETAKTRGGIARRGSISGKNQGGEGMARFFGGKRVLLVVLVLVSASFLIGAGMARRVLARGDDYENLRVFTEVLSLVQSNYVEDMENKKLVEGAIKGMLKTLDPHTSYMPPEMYKEMQVETEGQFGGLGIEITIRDDQLTVVSPIEDTPAYR